MNKWKSLMTQSLAGKLVWEAEVSSCFPAGLKLKGWFCNESCEMSNVQHNVALNLQLNLNKFELLQIQERGLQMCGHVLQIHNHRL